MIINGSKVCYCIVQKHRYEPEEGYYLVELELIGHQLYLILYSFFDYPKLPRRVFHKKINNRYLIKWLKNKGFFRESTHTVRDIKEFSFDNKSITEVLHKIQNLTLSEVLEIYY